MKYIVIVGMLIDLLKNPKNNLRRMENEFFNHSLTYLLRMLTHYFEMEVVVNEFVSVTMAK